MIKKSKGDKEPESFKKKEPELENTENEVRTSPVDNDAESGAENETFSSESAEKAGNDSEKAKKSGAETEGDKKKQLTENDVLKLYLKQALENSKKQKDEIDSLKSQVEQLNSQSSQCKKQLESLTAEYENYRRRTTAEKESISLESTSKIVLSLLPTLDNLERAMPFSDSNPESFKKGVEMTLNQLQDAFKSLGVEEIEAKGAEFNPELHDAAMHVEDDSIGESIITDVFQKGYRIGDKVVRHSVVKVAN